jgi:hypothetical protein
LNLNHKTKPTFSFIFITALTTATDDSLRPRRLESFIPLKHPKISVVASELSFTSYKVIMRLPNFNARLMQTFSTVFHAFQALFIPIIIGVVAAAMLQDGAAPSSEKFMFAMVCVFFPLMMSGWEWKTLKTTTEDYG